MLYNFHTDPPWLIHIHNACKSQQPGQTSPDSRAASEKMNSFLMEELFNERTLAAVQKLKPIAQYLGLRLLALNPHFSQV